MNKHVRFGKKQRVVDELGRRIRSGEWSSGRQLPGEHQLATEFNVSRGTLRQALLELQRQQYIATQSGVGSFVTFDGIALDQQQGWARALARSGVRIVTELLSIECVHDDALADRVHCNRFVEIVRRRRLAEGEIVSLERSLIPARGQLSNLPEHGLLNDSITDTLAAHELIAARGEQWLSIAALDEQQAQQLNRATGTLFMQSTRLTLDADDRFVEHVTSLLDPTHFHFHLAFDS
ncbi:GntR family transcriptional regulator [Kushneria sinocarnis]|uniref:GntR family transcriptional regulator n=1 Tax=Kushneria sinocarnis TaxID=595502 RepID=A0A420WW82_9GAMM|nr:GntR family transcriptional regulator [Kushneria sinocarnis]RKR03367.1 GntR family transcriptional regulator [Kushneria sinocarnis]